MVKIIMKIISLARKHLVTSVLVVCAIVGTIYTVKTYYATLRSIFLSQDQTKTSTANPPSKEDNKSPIKRDTNNSVHKKKPPIKPDLQSQINVVQSMKDSPGGVQVGVNNAPLTINPVPPPKPFDERLRIFLNDLDSRILPALKTGHTTITLRAQIFQISALEKICREKEANEYIQIVIKPDTFITPDGQFKDVVMKLNPNLVQ